MYPITLLQVHLMRYVGASTPLAIPSASGHLSGALFSPVSPGDYPCIILCHGAFEYKENFFRFAECLAEQGFHALAIDMPGHGQSDGERHCINIPAWVSGISSVIDNLVQAGISRRIGVFGFSSGGTAVLEAAITEPRINAVATLDATVRNYMGFWDTLLFQSLIGIAKLKRRLTGTEWRLDLTGELKKAKVAHDPEVNQGIVTDPRMIEAYRALPLPGAAPCAFVDTLKRVGAIKAPILVMHGQEDQIDNVKTAHLLFERLTCEKSLEIIPESGHCGHLDTHSKKIMALTARWMAAYLKPAS